jgi:hypothetical protein
LLAFQQVEHVNGAVRWQFQRQQIIQRGQRNMNEGAAKGQQAEDVHVLQRAEQQAVKGAPIGRVSIAADAILDSEFIGDNTLRFVLDRLVGNKPRVCGRFSGALWELLQLRWAPPGRSGVTCSPRLSKPPNIFLTCLLADMQLAMRAAGQRQLR